MSQMPPTPDRAGNRRTVRIGHVIWSLGLGGAEQVVIQLASESLRRGDEVSVFTLNAPGTFAAQAAAGGVRVISVAKRSRYDLTVLARLAGEFRRARLDVVHTHLWGAHVWGRLAAALARVRVVVATEHNLDTWKPRGYFIVDRLLSRLTTHLVAVSGPVRDFYEQHGVGVGRWHVIRNGIAVAPQTLRRLGDAHRALGLADGDRVIGWVGRLVPAKAPGDFLEAVSLAATRVPRLRAVIVGDGPLRQEAEARARELGLQQRVVFAGLRTDVSDLLSGMEALVFSSEREGLSIAMLEGMAAGVPIVATRVGGTPELVEDGRTGLLVPAHAPAELADRIARVLEDAPLASALARGARDTIAARFSFDAMASAYEELYQTREPRARGARPLEICFVIDDLHLGGAQQQLLTLLRGLPRSRFAPSVIALSTEKRGLEAAFRDSGVPLTLLPHSGKWSWATLWRLRRELRRSRPDIVHTWLFTADLYGRLAARMAGVPVVLSALRSVDAGKPWHYVAADRVLRHLTDAYTVNAAIVGEVLRSRDHVPVAKVHTIYNGVEAEACTASAVECARQSANAPEGTPLVGIVGRLAPEKGHGVFLAAAAEVARRLPSARFVVAGDGPLREMLELQARELGIADRVAFLGAVRPVAPVLAALDLLVVASHFEGCSNVILEAMAAGRPVVATSVGGNPELVVPGETGVLVPDGDASAMADAIVSLLCDRTRAAQLGRAGRLRYESAFTVERMVEASAGLYASLARRAR
jgi:glycosyltransferase involved in cell wall biosynthesis